MREQNRAMERANYMIVEMARSMIHIQHLKLDFWAKVLANVVYNCNRCPARALITITSQEAWSSRKPCIAYVMVLDAKRDKLDAKDIKCLFLSYCEALRHIKSSCVLRREKSSRVMM